MSEYIALGLNIALAVFIGFGIIFGLIRGLRKTASRGIFLIITSVILLFVTIPITSAILKIKVNTDITYMDNTLKGRVSFIEIIEFYVENLLGQEFSTQNPEFVNVITAIPVVFMNSIIYLVLFIICKYALLPLNYLFYRLIFAPKKPKEALGFSEFNNSDGNYTPIEENSTDNDTSADNSSVNVDDIITNELGLRVIEESRSAPPDKVDNYSEILSNVQNENSLDTTLDTTDDNSNAYAPTPDSTFGKEGTFIKTEIEEPVIERVTPVDIEKSTKDKKSKKQKKQKIKYKKHRLLGGLVGAICGIFIMCNILIPVYGFMEILKDANAVELDNVTDTQIDLSYSTNGVTDDIIKGYDLSILSRVSKYTGVEGLALAEFDWLTTQKINNKKITLREDVNNIIITVQKTNTLMGKYRKYTQDDGLKSLTQEELDGLIADTKEVVNQAESVNLIDCVADYLVPVICSALIKSEIKISENQIVNRLAIDAIRTLAESQGINAFNELKGLLDLADYLNTQKLLLRLIHNDFSNPIAMIKEMDEDFGEVFTKKLYNLKTVELTLPYVVNIGLNALEQVINYGYSENSATASEIKTGLTSFIDNAFRTARTLDENSNIYITNSSLIPLGKLLQTAKTSKLLTTDTYKNLVKYAIEKAQEMLKGIAPADLEDYFLYELIGNLSKVDNWEYEMECINKAVLKLRDIDSGILGDIEEGKNLRQGTNINFVVKKEVFINLGEALDILEGTCLFGTRTYAELDSTNYAISGTISMFGSLLNYGKTALSETGNSSLSKLNNVLDEMRVNLIKSKHTYDVHEATFWTNELKNIAPLAIDIYDMLESNDTKNLSIDSELGKSLDKAKSTVMLQGTTTLTVVDTAMKIVEENIIGKDFVYNDGTDSSTPQTLNNKIYKLFSALHDNLNNDGIKEQVRLDSKFWEKELAYYSNLQHIAENASTINSITDANKLSGDLDAIIDSITIPSDEMFGIIAFVVRDLKSSGTSAIDIEINNLLDKIASKLENNNFADYNDFWTIELDYMTKLMDIDFTADNVLDNLKSIGNTIDIVLNGYTIIDDPDTEINESKSVRYSYLIEDGDIRNLLVTAINNMSSKITDNFDSTIQTSISNTITSITNNIRNINITPICYERELGLINKLSNLSIPSDILNNPIRETTDTDDTYNAKLENSRLSLINLGKELDGIAYNTEISNTEGLKYTSAYSRATGNSKFITRTIISNLVSDVLDIAQITSSTLSTKEEAYNGLITDIKTQIEDIDTAQKTMSWAREFDFVNKLKELNADTNYTIDNVATELGKNLDTIAFNLSIDSTKYNDIEYIYDSTNNKYLCSYIPESNGNSLIITREAIIKVMQGFMSDTLKDIQDDTTLDSAEQLDNEQNKIINEIIKNSYLKVAYNNTMLNAKDSNSNNIYYSNFEKSLTDLKNIGGDNGTISSLMDTANGDIKDMSADTAESIDNLLNSLENRPIAYIQITRRIAKLILNKLDTPPDALASAKSYYNELINHFNSRLSDTQYDEKFEYYLGTDLTLGYVVYANPFTTLQSKLSAYL